MEQARSASTLIDPGFVQEFGEWFKDAWNRHDGEAVASLCTDDVSWSDGALPRPAQGHAEVAGFVEAVAHAFPNFHVEEREEAPHVISSEQPRAFVPYRMSGTMLGGWKPLGAAATNRSFSIDAIDQWTFRGELISDYVTYYDSLEMARQLGVIPRQGTIGLRAAVHGQRLQAIYLRLRYTAPSPRGCHGLSRVEREEG